MLIFVVCAVAPFVIVLMILSANFIKIATANRGAVKIKYTEKALKVSGVRAAFTKKELRHFLANPMYIMNSGIGVIIMLIGAVVFIFKRGVALNYITELNKTGVALSPALLICVVLCIIAALNLVSAPSISLEGKNLWIAKSLPVKAFDVLASKVLMHILVCGVPTLVASRIFAFALQPGAEQFFLLVFIPLLFTILTAFLGVTINLQFPKFDWSNEIQPIKQGLATLVVWPVVRARGGDDRAVSVVFKEYSSPGNVFVICAAALVALVVGLYAYLKNGGSRRFAALDN
jgi:ABC-2 type transport system permease protein